MLCPREPQAVLFFFFQIHSSGYPILRVPGGAAVLQPSPGRRAQASARASRLASVAGPLDQAQPVSPGQCTEGYPQSPPVPQRGRSNAVGRHLSPLRLLLVRSSGAGCLLATPPSTSLSGLVSPGLGSARMPRSTSGPPPLVGGADSRTSACVSVSLTVSFGCCHLSHSLPLVFQAVRRPHRAVQDPRSMAHKGCQGFCHSLRSISGENRGPGRQDYCVMVGGRQELRVTWAASSASSHAPHFNHCS
ncbi:hypothetical protein NDU88_009277 [Pleurodeles waltl]|uniref:Uncharacterized protein n=1 Tax=Pleurodeles waltl TaxID=8319 RepID=A0AAV7PYK3_PLEWA|nr:hypothetical protein NDU88_009277 [Pleurodeles waltl]